MNNYYTTISFPSLGIEWDPIRSLTLGPFTIHSYGLISAVGLLLAVLYGWKRCSEFGIKGDDITDGVLWIVPFAIICTRAYYVIFKELLFKFTTKKKSEKEHKIIKSYVNSNDRFI